MMKKIVYLFSVIVTLSMSSCIDFLEQISFQKDGSGEYSMRVDATKFMEEMEAFASMDTTGEMMPNMKKMLDSTFRASSENVKSVKGIKNLKFDASTPNIFITTYSFENIDALNEAMKNGESDQKQFEFTKKKLLRTSAFKSLDLEGILGKGEDEEGQQAEMMKQMFADMKMTTVYTLPSKVKSVSNKAAVISDDKKTVTFESTFKELLDKTTDKNLEINY